MLACRERHQWPVPYVLFRQPSGDTGGCIGGIAIDPFLPGTRELFGQVAQGVVAGAGLDRQQVLEEPARHDPEQALGAGSPGDLMALPAEDCGLVKDAGCDGGRKLDAPARDAVMLSGQLAAGHNDEALGAIPLAGHDRALGGPAGGAAFCDLAQPRLRERRKQRDVPQIRIFTAHGSLLRACKEFLAAVYQAIRNLSRLHAYVVPMICVELRFDGNPDRLHARARHRQRLDELHAQGDLLLAGPWSDESGALLIFSADGNRVRQIIQDDPYYSTPGVTVLAVREWTPVAGDR